MSNVKVDVRERPNEIEIFYRNFVNVERKQVACTLINGNCKKQMFFGCIKNIRESASESDILVLL